MTSSASAIATATAFTIFPLMPAFVARLRATRRDDFGREVDVIIAEGGEPMRDQLRRASPGERMFLCSYQAVPLPSPFAEIGPVYVSADAPPPAAFTDELPPGYFNRTFAVRAYDAQDRIVESKLVEPSAAAATFREMLARPNAAYLHARFGGHGCFAALIQRAGTNGTTAGHEQPFGEDI